MKWHCTFREGVIKSGSKRPNFDSKWGRFLPAQRINVDQVPLPFAIDRKTTYEPKVTKENRKDHKVWVANPGPGLEKRQCTLQIAFSPVGSKLRIAIIFRGTGKRISEDEKAAYHKDVDIYWQENAWADTKVCCEWVNRTLKEGVKDFDDEFLLLCDNLEGQISYSFKEQVRLIEGLVWYGLKNATELWQPMDGGVGRILKALIGQEQQDWLESDDNLDLWMGNAPTPLNAKQRRILITHWVGDSWNKMNTPEYHNLFYRCFQRTRCLITVDGSDDNKINPEGLVGYVVPPPLPTVSSDQPVAQDPVIPNEIPDEILDEVEEEDAPVPDVQDDDLEDDHDYDRHYDHVLVGRKIKVIYDNGWFTGVVTYYNVTMNKLRVQYDDGTDDYIEIGEINGSDVQLLD